MIVTLDAGEDAAPFIVSHVLRHSMDDTKSIDVLDCALRSSDADLRVCVANSIHGFGKQLGEATIGRLRSAFLASPGGLAAPLLLLSAYFSPSHQGDVAFARQVLEYLIRHHPSAPALLSADACLFQCNSSEVVAAVGELWMSQVARFPGQPQVLANAANFFILRQPSLAEELLVRAVSVDRPDWRLLRRLVSFHRLRADVGTPEARLRHNQAMSDRLQQLLGLPLSTSYRSDFLQEAATVALRLGVADRARQLANRLLELARDSSLGPWPSGWDSLHQANALLGRVALRQRDLAGARACLAASLQFHVAPHRSEFTPDMSLASELLDHGERDVVLQFLKDLAPFWLAPDHELELWSGSIRVGKKPNFGQYEEDYI